MLSLRHLQHFSGWRHTLSLRRAPLRWCSAATSAKWAECIKLQQAAGARGENVQLQIDVDEHVNSEVVVSRGTTVREVMARVEAELGGRSKHTAGAAATLPNGARLGIGLDTPLPFDCRLTLFTADSEEGLVATRCTGAVLMARAVQEALRSAQDMHAFPGLVAALPRSAVWHELLVLRGEEGENIDVHNSLGLPSAALDMEAVSARATEWARRGEQLQCVVVSLSDAVEMVRDNPLQVDAAVARAVESQQRLMVPMLRCGDFVSVAPPVHVSSASLVWKVLSKHAASSIYSWGGGCGVADELIPPKFRGVGNGEELSVQRVHGVVFASKDDEAEWERVRKESEERDHRAQGAAQELMMFHKHSPGAPFFLPRGMRLFSRLVEMIRSEYRRRGYDEVMTPNVMSADLWRTSGHLEHYEEDMYSVRGCCHGSDSSESDSTASDSDGPEEVQMLKPMNCPGHCLIFASTTRSYKDLPLRLAEFGTLHRNELSGALTGLTRVRRFHQDDAHIFCRADQVSSEVSACIDFVRDVYQRLGILEGMTLNLATRPCDGSIGSDEQWDEAESALARSLSTSELPWDVNEGDGAFYGPKIDIAVSDVFGRVHQCATIQLDFQLPERFDLHYINENNTRERPVMVHRAVLGSVERMMAMLIEKYGRHWPFWLSPRQCRILPIGAGNVPFARELRAAMAEIEVVGEVDEHVEDKLGARIRDAAAHAYNYTLVVGDKEQADESVSVRRRGSRKVETCSITTLLGEMKEASGAFQ